MGLLRLDPMKTSFALLTLLGAALIASAQESPTIKGHKIGESINEYLTTENGGADSAARALTDCATLLNNPKERKKQAYRAENCQQIAAAWNGDTVELTGEAKGGKFEFASRKLVAIGLLLFRDFNEVEPDLIEKFGPPDTKVDAVYENVFGAVYVHPRAAWTRRPDITIFAIESPSEPSGVIVLVTDRAYSDSLKKKEGKRPNSLN